MELRARFEQLVQCANFLGNCSGREVIHVFEAHVDRHVALAGERIRYGKRHTRFDRLHARIKIIKVNFRKFAISYVWERLF